MEKIGQGDEMEKRYGKREFFLGSNLSNLLTSLIFGERPEGFTHMSHQKRGNERFAHFFNIFFLNCI